ncbi:uncharacterized protein [Ptychodera flava]|uniref:uncharacterized protein n=1 Tax=Ptychodera flava TaxID=63121 RepID=UPI003969DC15
MVLWQCSPTLDTVCVKFRRLDDNGNEFVVRPRILMEKPIDSHVIADIYNKSRQEHAERERKRQELERLRAENMTFDSNVTETLNTGIGVEGHELFSTVSPEMGIMTSSRDPTVAKTGRISRPKASRTNDQHFTTSLHKHLNLVTVEDPGINLEEDGYTPGQVRRSTGVYTAIISTASFLVVVVVLVLLTVLVWRRRAHQRMTYCAREECRGYQFDDNAANVPGNLPNGSSLVVSLDAGRNATTGVIRKSDNPERHYIPAITRGEEDGQFSTRRGCSVSSKTVQDVPTPRKITNKSEAAARATESPLTSNHLHNPDNIYDIIFEGLFDQKGGVLSHEDSDVQLHIPRGAIPSGEKQPIIVKVSLRVSYFNVGLKDGQIPLTPVVECLSPGLDSFLDYVTVKLPHRALLPGKDAKSWRFLVHYNQSMDPRDKSWSCLTNQNLARKTTSSNRLHSLSMRNTSTFKQNISRSSPAPAAGRHGRYYPLTPWPTESTHLKRLRSQSRSTCAMTLRTRKPQLEKRKVIGTLTQLLELGPRTGYVTGRFRVKAVLGKTGNGRLTRGAATFLVHRSYSRMTSPVVALGIFHRLLSSCLSQGGLPSGSNRTI